MGAIRQGEEKLKQLEKLQKQQTTVLELMLPTATNTTSSVDIYETVCTEEMRQVLKRVDTEELTLALHRAKSLQMEEFELALERAKSLQMEEFEVFKKAENLFTRWQFLCVFQYMTS